MPEQQETQEQYYSTGRGGLGNITNAKSPEIKPQKSSQSQLTSTYSHDKDGNYILSTGRGGQLNLVHTSTPPQPPLLQPTVSNSSQLQPVYSTGRGGYGNMRANKISEEFEGDDNDLSSNKSNKKGLLKKVKNLFK